jgi:hypothetical protein
MFDFFKVVPLVKIIPFESKGSFPRITHWGEKATTLKGRRRNSPGHPYSSLYIVFNAMRIVLPQADRRG